MVYGQGVYFAINSHYSDAYAKCNVQGVKKMFRARVVTGESCLGNSLMKVPPQKSNGIQYDSTTDPKNEIYVCYHDSQCYPDYLITYA